LLCDNNTEIRQSNIPSTSCSSASTSIPPTHEYGGPPSPIHAEVLHPPTSSQQYQPPAVPSRSDDLSAQPISTKLVFTLNRGKKLCCPAADCTQNYRGKSAKWKLLDHWNTTHPDKRIQERLSPNARRELDSWHREHSSSLGVRSTVAEARAASGLNGKQWKIFYVSVSVAS
jgi:hypothetical protein